MCNRTLIAELLLVVALGTASLAAATAGGCSWRASSSWFGGEICVLQKVYDDCHETSDFSECLKQRALTTISRAIDLDSIQLIDGVSLVKQRTSSGSTGEQGADNGPIAGLSDARSLEGLSGTDQSLLRKIDQFLKSHTISFDLSEARGSGNKKNGSRYVIAAMLTAMGIAGPIGLKTLGAIAFKALVISKVALTIASIMALKKIFKADRHEETSFQVHTGHDNRRATYFVRPVRGNDPYRYYYEQPAV